MPYKDPAAGRRYRRAVREENRKKVKDYLNEHPCVGCGFTDIRTLAFDHPDPSKKRRSVSDMVKGTPSWKTLLAVMESCQVMCANCHIIKTIVNKDYLNRTNRSILI